MDRQNKNAVVLERVCEGRKMLELIKKRKNKLAGPLAKKELPAEGCSRRNGKREKGSRQKNKSDDIQHYDKWTMQIRKEGCEEGRVENAEFAMKYLPLGRTL